MTAIPCIRPNCVRNARFKVFIGFGYHYLCGAHLAIAQRQGRVTATETL